MEIYAYLRENGSIGIRNRVLVLPAVACVNHVAEMIARNIEGVVGLRHEVGCAQLGDDYRQSLRTLFGSALNPNVGAVLVIGLGCERVDPEQLAHEIAQQKVPVECMKVQDVGGTTQAIAKGMSIAAEMANTLSLQKREKTSLERIVVGVECGGSDFTSSLSSNPAVGYAVDQIWKSGGRIIISETTELIGAEKVLEQRCKTPEVAEKLWQKTRQMIEHSKHYTRDDIDGVSVPNNISPGNVKGGLTTIEEKSLGAVSKGGYLCPIIDVVDYAQPISAESGLYIMDSPGYDPESMTGMVAGGCTVVLFTTGLGTPLGNPIAPVIKITGNRRVATVMKDDIDIDVSGVIEDEVPLEQAGTDIFDVLCHIINGKRTRSEVLRYWDVGIMRIGPRL